MISRSDPVLIGPEEVEFLELALHGAGVPMSEFQAKFGVARLVQLPDERLEEAKAWIAGAAKALQATR